MRWLARAAGFAWQFGLAQELGCEPGPELILRALVIVDVLHERAVTTSTA